ncbi:sensor domain-containing diguanylate cyclase [Simplicispira lacusdiani]|uniref:sensor domain-containing diguanylate cyclase n=1 Tax=Simplicispira lacusdiani TaxID=2213010 RepID=UPI000E722012|nr:diguanylate cyclase [Simplicispira lacusdiani]
MPPSSAPPSRRIPFLSWKALPLLAIVVLAGMFWSVQSIHQDRERRYRHQVEWELQAISQLQSKSVAEWRERRLSDAMALTDDTLFAQSVARWLQQPVEPQASQVLDRLRTLQERARYTAVYLVDTQGQLRLSPGGSAQGPLPEPEQQALRRALAQAQAMVVEPRRDAFFAFPFFGLLAPLFEDMVPVGAVWLVSDVRTTLYPLLENWPTPSTTAESALVLREGDEVAFLSPLRHHGDPPLSLRLPMGQGSDPAVLAANGERGILYGRDYRGEEVLAMVSAVPDSPWYMVTKVDIAEAFSDIRAREWLALSLPISLVLLFAGFLAAHWQWRARRRERALKTEVERNMRWLQNAQKAASLGYFAYDVAREEFFMSDMASQIYGLPPDGRMLLSQWVRLLHPEERTQILAVHDQAMKQHTALRTQYRLIRPSDQQVRWVEVWGEYEVGQDKNLVSRMTGTVQDITERKQAEEQLARYRAALEAQVRLDPLTHVANRLALDEAVAREWNRAMRSGAPLALLMIDVDHFKAYNDHYGHVAGDQCLQQVAQALSHAVGREGDLAARYGGEEFAVLLPDTAVPQAMALAERICGAVRALGIAHLAAQGRDHVTVSIGVACIHPGALAASDRPVATTPPTSGFPSATEVAQALFEQADTALYNAKKAGRDRVMACPSSPMLLPALSRASSS